MAKHPAAFINSIWEEGDKEEAITWLQNIWDDLQNLQIALIKLGFTRVQVEKMQQEGTIGKVF